MSAHPRQDRSNGAGRSVIALQLGARLEQIRRRMVYKPFKAADALVLSETRSNARAMRNRAILAVLYYTGLRVSELVALRREQYVSGYLVNVARKGEFRSKGIYLLRNVGDCSMRILQPSGYAMLPQAVCRWVWLAGAAERRHAAIVAGISVTQAGKCP